MGLSGGLKKVGNVFRTKSKEEQTASKAETKSATVTQTKPCNAAETKENIKPFVDVKVIETPTDKPEIPGLVFKTDIQRRPSKKKRSQSRPKSSYETEARPA